MNAEQAMATILQNVDAGSRPAFPLTKAQRGMLRYILNSVENRMISGYRGKSDSEITDTLVSYGPSRHLHCMVVARERKPGPIGYLSRIYNFAVGPAGGLITFDSTRKYNNRGPGKVIANYDVEVTSDDSIRTCPKCGRAHHRLYWVDRDDFLTAVKARRSRQVCGDCVRG